MSVDLSLNLPEAFNDLFLPFRFKVYYGGRGSAKSWSIAQALLVIAMMSRVRILCAREIQASMSDSVIRLLADQIELMGFSPFFRVYNNGIFCTLTGSQFMFKGLRHNVHDIKSTEGVDICWVEEAQRVSQGSWDVLIPTIRKDVCDFLSKFTKESIKTHTSEIWISFNPEMEADPTYQRFIVNTPENAAVHKVNWYDNQYFPQVLRDEMEYCKRVDYDAYLHIWEGELVTKSDAQVLNGKWRVDSFETPTTGQCYFGADWGFSRDPTTLIRMWIVGKSLYIDWEAWGIGVELDKIPELFDLVPNSRTQTIRADCARPETISYIRNKGFQCIAAEKWSGSVEDGVAFLRSFEEIVIHQRCVHTIQEARTWKYKQDRLTEDVLPTLIDANNHCWDAVRYALQPQIKMGGSYTTFAFFEEAYQMQQAELQAEREKYAKG